MSERPDDKTAEEWSALLGDDIAYWMGNPFLSPQMRADKVAWWLNRLAASETSAPAPPEPKPGADS